MQGSGNQTHVWVFRDLVEAAIENSGSSPPGWVPSRKRGRSSQWDWLRAKLITSAPKEAGTTSPFGQQVNLRKAKGPSTKSRVLQGRVTVCIDDSDATPDFQNQTIEVDNTQGDLIHVANSWWKSGEEPPQDLTTLTHLNEPAVVYCLRKRYENDQIYTYTGKILLALNPFRQIKGLYGQEVIPQYLKTSSEKVPPHIYSTAQDAYSCMRKEQQDQSILVSGESGSGKTVTTKIILGYLTTVSRHVKAGESRSDGVESQVVHSNPILESFGNARTIRNDNSSRFGKFIDIKFRPSGRLKYASIETYLLEKVRLITQAPGERNYHIFYELLTGLPQSERNKLCIGNTAPQDFRMTAASGTLDRRDGVNDQKSFRTLRKAMATIGFSTKEETELFSACCALLHCSNLAFVESMSGDCSLEGSNVSLRHALKLLGVSLEVLNTALCYSAIEARGETMHKKLTKEQSTKALEALTKAVYSAMFKHIVTKINSSLALNDEMADLEDDVCEASIGVLDIFGFESFDTNSFEQLCINYCNETIQHQFNQFVFEEEQKEYALEDIEWSFIPFPNNQDVLDLIERKREGLLSILDEQVMLPRSTDQTFANAVYDKCASQPRIEFSNSQRIQGKFSIEHYAGSVEYTTHSFLEKNKDELPKGTAELFKSSSVDFVKRLGELLHHSEERTNGTSPKSLRRGNSSLVKESVGRQFSHQLHKLREKLDKTSPHYVRCLKPNDWLVPSKFVSGIIADQLRCAGVMEAIRVSREGFPQRFLHADFLQRYFVLSSKTISSRRHTYSEKEMCQLVVDSAITLVQGTPSVEGSRSPSRTSSSKSTGRDESKLGVQMGRRKVFLRGYAFERLEHLRDLVLEEAVTLIQSTARQFLARNRYYAICWATSVLQNLARRLKAVKVARAARWERSATRIQSKWRSYSIEQHFLAAVYIAHWAQRTQRGIVAREVTAFMLIESKVSRIQRVWRRSVASRSVRNMIGAVVRIQCMVRSWVARKTFAKLRREARDVVAVAKQRDTFRDEALRWRMEVEKLKRGNGIAESESDEINQLKEEIRNLQEFLASTNRSSFTPTSKHRKGPGSTQSDVAIALTSPTAAEANFDFQRDSQSDINVKSSTPARLIPAKPTPIKPSPMKLTLPPRALAKSRDAIPLEAMSTASLLDSEAGEEPEDATDILFGEHQSVGYTKFDYAEASKYAILDKKQNNAFGGELLSFHHAIITGDEQRAFHIAASSASGPILVNECDQHGKSPLHLAVLSGKTSLVTKLIECGAVANIQDLDGNTPLHITHSAEIIAILLEKGKANPNIPNNIGICALHQSVERLDVPSVIRLLSANADVNVADNERWVTPLHLVARNSSKVKGKVDIGGNRKRIAQLLCARESPSKPDLAFQDKDGNSPLHHAAVLEAKEAQDVFNLFLDNGSDANSGNGRGQTPLHLLCHNNKLRQAGVMQEMLHNLLCHNADPNRTSQTGCTALHLALYHRDVDSAVQLVSKGAELHLMWRKPKRWVSFWDDMGDSEILPLDMVSSEHALHRILAAIKKPTKCAPNRPWCMHCKSALGSFARALHCRHCGRLVCGACSERTIEPEYFPKSFEVFETSWVCIVCDKILISRKPAFGGSGPAFEGSSKSTSPESMVSSGVSFL